MARLVVLLRGINIGSRNRISMPELREALEDAGYDDVRTYLQSGNVVLDEHCEREEGGAEVRAADRGSLRARDRGRRADAQRARQGGRPKSPRRVAKDPKRYQVSFLETKPAAKVVRELEEVATAQEEVVSIGREIYAWHPAGVARSKLWARLAGKNLGVTATARNWTTVTKLLELADAD